MIGSPRITGSLICSRAPKPDRRIRAGEGCASAGDKDQAMQVTIAAECFHITGLTALKLLTANG
jgi:hypothetical protein